MKRITGAARCEAVSPREEENRQVSLRAALEGVVLLKNDGGALPIAPGRIALYGAGVPMTVKGGTGSGEVNERHDVSILDGMRASGYTVASELWLADYAEEYARAYQSWKRVGSPFDIINHMANPFQPPVGRVISQEDIRRSDCAAAIYVVARQAGEGADKKLEKGEFALKPDEIESISRMAGAYERSVLVINSGSYMDLAGVDKKVSAVIWFCQQGMEGGTALAMLLSGQVSPSGKLSDSWFRSYDDVPFGMEYSYLNGDTLHEYYREGIYVGYRYCDSFGVRPRYPFGFGLSYTEFTVSGGRCSISGDTVTVEAAVRNTGGRAGKEVAQLYGSLPEGRLKKERQRLLAFGKTDELRPGGEQTLTLSFTLRDLASYEEAGSRWIIEPGDIVLRLGDSSVNTQPVAVISLDELAVLSQNRPICPLKAPLDELTPPAREPETLPEGVARLTLRAGDIAAETVDYCRADEQPDERVKTLVDGLSQSEKIDLCVGEGLGGMMRTGGVFAPGAVGRTTGSLEKKGLHNLNLSDGPAGLRLLRVSALNRKGKLRFVDGQYMISGLDELPGWLRGIFNAGDGDERLYQFTSSFPVETALAQSWNTALCQEVGAAISREMAEYRISFWLAPALNIHRNPLCGRNFEYFSEDPLLTGKIAAALTRGIQSRPGCYATAKHFACNNCEDNRNRSDSIVGERALREIYLRGFEICVREAQPKSVMTSYNKLNGVYAPNSYDLCTAALRREWGFDGLVMTDWYSTRGSFADAGDCLIAGNDLLMPGQGSDKRSIKKALRMGTLRPEELDRSAGRIAKAVLESGAAD